MGVGWLQQCVPPPTPHRIKLRDLGSRRMETEACRHPRASILAEALCKVAEGAPRRRILRDQCGHRVSGDHNCVLPAPTRAPVLFVPLRQGGEPERNTSSPASRCSSREDGSGSPGFQGSGKGVCSALRRAGCCAPSLGSAAGRGLSKPVSADRPVCQSLLGLWRWIGQPGPRVFRARSKGSRMM